MAAMLSNNIFSRIQYDSSENNPDNFVAQV